MGEAQGPEYEEGVGSNSLGGKNRLDPGCYPGSGLEGAWIWGELLGESEMRAAFLERAMAPHRAMVLFHHGSEQAGMVLLFVRIFVRIFVRLSVRLFSYFLIFLFSLPRNLHVPSGCQLMIGRCIGCP